MALYRVIRNVWWKDTILLPGAVARLHGISEKTRDTLIGRGIIREVAGPPLSELQGWEIRSDRLSGMGIVGSVEFLEVEPERVAAYLGVSPALVRRWQQHVEAAITVAPARERA